jgi:hypothetical protein
MPTRPNIATSPLSMQYIPKIAMLTAPTYAALGNIHNQYCHTGGTGSGYEEELFLHWHRAYLKHFEIKLGMTISYINWTNLSQINALQLPLNKYSAPFSPPNNTNRKSNWKTKLLNFHSQNYTLYLSKIISVKNFCKFSIALESFHDAIHFIIGGDMGINSTATKDPIFWLHHCFIDYQWAKWQANFTSTNLQPAYSSTAFSVFNSSLGSSPNIYNINSLGYNYGPIPGTPVAGTDCSYDEEMTFFERNPSFFKVSASGDVMIDWNTFNKFLAYIPPAGNAKIANPETFKTICIHFSTGDRLSLQLRVTVNDNYIGDTYVFGMADRMSMSGMEGRRPTKFARYVITNAFDTMAPVVRNVRVRIEAFMLDGRPISLRDAGVVGISLINEPLE